MTNEDDSSRAHLPDWARAVERRLTFFAGSPRSESHELQAALRDLRARADNASSAGSRGSQQTLLQDFLRGCLAEVARAAASRQDLRQVRADLLVLCDLARLAISSDCDDRPLLARARALNDLEGPAGWAIRAPGRVVWLAAMAGLAGGASVAEEGGAATMLVNDLAALDPALPLRALQAALRA